MSRGIAHPVRTEDIHRHLTNEHFESTAHRLRLDRDPSLRASWGRLARRRSNPFTFTHLEMNMIVELGKITEETKSWGPVETLDSLSIMAKMGT
jgi:hypothetical protein